MLYTLCRTNSLVQKYMDTSISSEETQEQLDGTLSGIRTLNPLVDSIVIYNNEGDKYFFHGQYHVDMRPFFVAYLNTISQQGALVNLSKNKNIFRYIIHPANEPREENLSGAVISVMYYNVDSSKTKYNCITINLNSQKVTERIILNKSDEILLLNEYGTIVLCSLNNSVPDLSNRIRWSQNLTENNSQSGYFFDVLENKNQLVSYYKLSGKSWFFYQIMDNFQLVDLKNWTFIMPIILLTLFLSAIISWLIINSLYKPFKKTLRRLDESSSSQQNQFKPNIRDEFTFIDTIVTNLSNRVTSLEIENANILSREKRGYLLNIITTEEESNSNYGDWTLYNIEVLPENIFVAIIKEDKNGELELLNNMEFEVIIRETMKQYLKEEYHYEVVRYSNDEVIVLINVKNSAENPENEIVLLLEQYQNFVHKNSHISISITIAAGGLALKYNEIGKCYNVAQELLKQRFVLGYGQLITQNYVKMTLSRDLKYPVQLIDELEQNIKDTDKSKFLFSYNKLLDILRKYYYQEVVTVLFQIITRCLHTMNSISVDNIRINFDINEFSALFNEMYTLEHTRNWFLYIFDKYIEATKKIELVTDNKYCLLVQQIKDHVKGNFSDQNLNVEQIARLYNYTSNHISKIFKNTTGQYLHKYITDIRIQQAKNLLRETNHSIHEISDMIGFSSYNYFFSFFKKETGLTPILYRHRCSIIK